MKRSVGRPRKKGAKKEQISVTLSKALINEVNNQLSYSQSRSKFIETAIRSHLGETLTTVANTSTKALCAALTQRDDCPTFILRAVASQYGWNLEEIQQLYDPNKLE